LRADIFSTELSLLPLSVLLSMGRSVNPRRTSAVGVAIRDHIASIA